MLGLLYLFPILSQLISNPGWHRHPQHITPATAGLKLQSGTSLSTLLIGGLLLRLRDT